MRDKQEEKTANENKYRAASRSSNSKIKECTYRSYSALSHPTGHASSTSSSSYSLIERYSDYERKY